MKKILIYCTLGFTLIACKPAPKPIDLQQIFQNMHWIEGSWQGEADGQPFCESWTFENDTFIVNKNLDCKTGDVKEDGARIQIIDQQIYYTNAPKEGEELLKWKLEDCDAEKMRFANPNAPYSQTIVFSKTPDGKWRADLTTKGQTITYLLEKR